MHLNQVRGFFKAVSPGKELQVSALRADMSENAARKYLQDGRVPPEVEEDCAVGAGFQKRQESPGFKQVSDRPSPVSLRGNCPPNTPLEAILTP